MASVSERNRADGRTMYEARVKVRGHPPLSKSFDNKVAAKRWAQAMEVQIRGGGKVSRVAAKTLVPLAIKEYREEHKDSISRGKGYQLDAVAHYFKKFTVESLTRTVIKDFITGMLKAEIPPPENKQKTHKLYDGDRERTYSPGAVRKLYYALKTAIEWHAVEHGYDLGGKFQKLPVPGAWDAPRERRLEAGEEAKLLAACEGMYKDPRGWQLLILLALETGMRAGELMGMRWVEINEAHRFIVIPKEREKTRRGRQVPISSRSASVLKELSKRRKSGEERVFATFPNDTVLLGRGFKRIVKRANLKDLRFHDLRHEATSRFFERTELQTLEIALITGHAELKTLQRYANLRPAILARKLDGGIEPGKRIR